MKVALVPSLYAPHVGGVEELTRRLAEEYLRRSDQVEVWTSQHPPALPTLETVEGVTVRRFLLPLPRARLRSVVETVPGALGSLVALLRARREFCPDVIHVQCFSSNGVYATVLSALTRTPLVVTMQGEAVMDDDDVYDRSALLRAGLRIGLRRARGVTGCSQFVVDDAHARFGLPAGKGTVVFNGVRNAGDAAPTPAGPGAPASGRFVLGLGRGVAKKGFDLLIDAFAVLAGDHPDVDLVIAGDGAALPALRQQAEDLGVGSRVHFPGRVGRSEVAQLMGAAEVFVLPSRVEPFGIVVLEAMRAGRPVVVSSLGGAPEVARHEVEGLVVDPTRRDDLAAAIGRLLGDPLLAARLGEGGRRRAAEFEWSDIAEQYLAVYRRAAASPYLP